MSARLERFAEALTSDWHDATCPEGKDCRDRDLHSRGLSWPTTLTKVIAQGAVIRVADEEHARLSAESQQAVALAAEAVKRQRERAEAAEARLAAFEWPPEAVTE